MSVDKLLGSHSSRKNADCSFVKDRPPITQWERRKPALISLWDLQEIPGLGTMNDTHNACIFMIFTNEVSY